jgi:hypothetical protein
MAGCAVALTGAWLVPAAADGPSPYLPSGVGTAMPAVDLAPATEVRPLRPSPQQMPAAVPWGEGTLPVEEFLTHTNTRAFVVLHEGLLVTEWYADGVDAGTRLASWSVAKSMVSLLAD